MKVSQFSVLMAIGLLMVVGIFTVGCSDDDKDKSPVAPTPRWTWAPLGTGMHGAVRALTVYDGQLIAGGAFSNARWRECETNRSLGPQVALCQTKAGNICKLRKP